MATIIIKKRKLHGTRGFVLVDQHTSEMVQNVCYVSKKEAQKALDLYLATGQFEEETNASEGSEKEGEIPSGGGRDGATSSEQEGHTVG